MNFPVLKGASYALIHANDMVLHQGSTQTNERILAPNSDYLSELPKHFRSFEAVVNYPPNQVYIGNLKPKDLNDIPRPWYNADTSGTRDGKHGEILPLDEFLGLVKIVDVFDLVLLEERFARDVLEKLQTHPVISKWKFLSKLTKNPVDAMTVAEQAENHGAEPIYHENVLVGCVKKAHAFDPALTAHVMFENLVSKASAAFVMGLLLHKSNIDPLSVEYIIECSEEACGDMNQRGGGNFAKAIGEVNGLENATGSDTRGFCAAPVHALVEAAALVQSGVYKNVIVVAGGSVAKLGMNAKDHVKKGLPVLEDVLGAFAALVGGNDGVSPVIRTDIVGRHTIGSGASPQAVTQAIVADPLDRAGLKLGDIDTFSVEMQNPEITEPAGAGDVPKANYKMIAALGVMRKEFERGELNDVVERIAMPGFAPTQGHIPSGVPFLGHCKDMMLAGECNRVMIVGKGSLFLGRLTNLFDGVSFLLEGNGGITANRSALSGCDCSVNDANGTTADRSALSGCDCSANAAPPLDAPQFTPARYRPFYSGNNSGKIKIGITLPGSEHGTGEIIRGANLVTDADIDVIFIDGADEKEAHGKMDGMLANGEIHAAVTLHYNFPIGVSTVGRTVTPARGRKVFVANTTGTSDTRRGAALLKNTVAAIAVAKANGYQKPTVGILNIEGANTLARSLQTLKDNGYDIHFTESSRTDGGIVMRGNDLLQGTPDIMVMDSLTGNVVMKMLSAFTTGGSYEAVGDGYGPGVGEGFDKIICILSRASGASVIAGAIAYAAACVKGHLTQKVNEEFANARKAGLDKMLEKPTPQENQTTTPENPESNSISSAITPPPEKVTTTEIPGIEILSLEDAVLSLWKNNIYATSGMGCTGPIILVAPEDEETARQLLAAEGYL